MLFADLLSLHLVTFLMFLYSCKKCALSCAYPRVAAGTLAPHLYAAPSKFELSL